MKRNWLQRLIRTSILAILLLTFSLGLSAGFFDTGKSKAPRQSILAQGDAITDPEAILRYALPIDNDSIRKIQGDIESLEKNIRRSRWSNITKAVKDASLVLQIHTDDIISSIPEDSKETSKELLSAISEQVTQLKEYIEYQKKSEILAIREEILDEITIIEESMVTGFPFEVPSEYANLPQLLGRATVEIETNKGTLSIVVDGYSSPVNGGNFVDLVNRGFYDGLPFIRAEDFFVLQTGKPIGEEEGFIDPETGEYRAIPLEVLVEGESEPIYEFTTEDAGLYLAKPVLPFNAYGAVALARPSTDPNGGSSQFFFFKFDTEVTPPGYNLMDGRFSVFGYLTEGKDVLNSLTEEDKIISAKVSKGIENLVNS